MPHLLSTGMRFAVLPFVLLSILIQARPSPRAMAAPATLPAAPVAVNLTPTAINTNGAFLVTISSPVFANGRMNMLALRAEVKAETSSKQVARVVFTLSRNGTVQYTQREQRAPYCMFGDQNNQCTALQAGDNFPNTSNLIRVGNYNVDIAVFSNTAGGATPDWQGSVKFMLEPGKIGAERPPYGTGQGNGPVATVVDGYYAQAGMRAIQIEVRAQNKAGRPNGTGIQRVTFRVHRLDDNDTQVYAGYELSKPYCIFGEAEDGATCRVLRVGDAWPQSTRLIFDDNGEATGKEADPDIPVSTIAAGEYNISIFIEADNGTWSSNGDVKLITSAP